MLTWAIPFNISCFLDNHSYASSSHSVECLLAAGAAEQMTAAAGDAFDQLREWAEGRQDWLFGHFAYDLASETEPVHAAAADRSMVEREPAGEVDGGLRKGAGRGGGLEGSLGNSGDLEGSPEDSGGGPEGSPGGGADPIGFPDLLFFVPEVIIELNEGSVRIGSFGVDQEAIWRQILMTGVAGVAGGERNVAGGKEIDAGRGTAYDGALAGQGEGGVRMPVFTPRFTREEYVATVEALQAHILRGDCYEINFCQEFFSRGADIDPLSAWFSLSQASPNPFAAYYRVDSSYLLCASPERFLKRSGDTLISQPIKGTAPRISGDEAADLLERDRLYNSPKDRSENVMVVDLVRNDLSRVCVPGSVGVEELFGIYPFPQVHQMISSVTGRMLPGLDWTEAIRASFPMGSMTGAPKNKVVELIGLYERSSRGIFSGAVGYVRPGGDFDFNVVIRSLMYNSHTRYLSYQVGSGITFYSDPAAEYEECMVKAAGLRKALGQ